MMVWSQLTMGASWRVGLDRSETTGLITTGPFNRVRNPIYTSMIVMAIGLTANPFGFSIRSPQTMA